MLNSWTARILLRATARYLFSYSSNTVLIRQRVGSGPILTTGVQTECIALQREVFERRPCLYQWHETSSSAVRTYESWRSQIKAVAEKPALPNGSFRRTGTTP